MAADSEARWLAEARKEYQEDSLKWLYQRFRWITERINEQIEWQASEAKSFAQNAAELHNRSLRATGQSLIFCVAVIAMIALASAGLWIGVAGVALFLVVERWWNLHTEKLDYRLHRFRRRFRELLGKASDSEMLAEDRAFIQKYADSILFPLAVADRGCEKPSVSDLWHIETLYREYCYSPDHHHLEGHREEKDLYLDWEKEHFKNCKLCKSARRVREHIEGVLSKFETAIESARQELIIQIDGSNAQRAIRAKDFLAACCEWERWHHPPEDSESPRDEKLRAFPLLKALRDKEWWTFEEADKVRELRRKEQRLSSYQLDSDAIYGKLSREMAGAAARCGLEQTWKFYNEAKLWFLEYGFYVEWIRRIIGRRKPETTIREFVPPNVFWSTPLFVLEKLKNYGYEGDMVKRELIAADKLLAKEGGEWDRTLARELAAAQAFALAEGAVSDRRYQEHRKAASKPPLALRMYRAVGKLIRKLFGVERFLSETHSTFEGWLLEVSTVSLFIGGVGLAVVGEIVERARGVRFPVGVAVIPVTMISASIFK